MQLQNYFYIDSLQKIIMKDDIYILKRVLRCMKILKMISHKRWGNISNSSFNKKKASFNNGQYCNP